MMIYLQTIETGEDKTKFEQIYAEYRRLIFNNCNAGENPSHDCYMSHLCLS